MTRLTNDELLFQLNVEEALQAASGYEAGRQQGAISSARNDSTKEARDTYLKLANSMGQSLQAMSGGLEAVAHALDNFRGVA